ncbi:MAG: heavy-metal-associated domain-containing protein [Clostridiales bacterium]|nr:heavy-metal-associated domain-containing protein [Clostridiales bacterium]
MKKKIFIDGMSCQHCVNRVTRALEEIPGVKSAKVDLDEKLAVVELDYDVDNDTFKTVIYDAGYDVTHIE